MSYVVLARKWRPMHFDDLVGQEHVARTLANAIASGRVAHAFLFTGVRGVGKTTSARILAKALNCMRPQQSRTAGIDPGPTATPCLECPACMEIAVGTDVDVREIDGASYNGVDEVRKLQDSLPYRPARDRYKIYIVDEVHMLSQSAWNAFLKTLEEPPPHVKFIFATTEVHKVPVTILSRVQRFDFKLIPTRLIAERLRYVLGAESIAADDRAISVVAREAAGSMRDAMSLLDQVIAWGGAQLSGEDVARVLGVASHQVLYDVARALIGGDAERCLGIVGELSNQGFDIAHVARDVLGLLRDLVVAKVCKDPSELLDLADEEKREALELAARSDADDLLRLHQGFSQAFDDVVKSGQQRGALEMLLVRLARRPPLVPIDEFVGRLALLERRLSSGAQRPAATPTGRTSASAPAANPSQTPASSARPRDTSALPAPTDAVAPSSVPLRGPAPSARSAPISSVPREPAGATSRAAVSAPTPVSLEAARAKADTAAMAQQLLEDWRAILELVQQSRPELAAFLQHAAPLDLKNGQLVVGWPPGSIFAAEASKKPSLELLVQAATTHFGTRMLVSFELDSERARVATTVASLDSEARDLRTREAIQQARQHPRVAEAIEILGARLKDVKLGND